MNTRKAPFTLEKLEAICRDWETPFHLYDEQAILDNARRLKAAFAWNPQFREFYAVKAAPNPYLLKLLRAEGFGCDCSSMAELVLSEKVGNLGDKVMFTSNDTPAAEFVKAAELGAVINFDDLTHIDFFARAVAPAGITIGSYASPFCCRWNPGPLKGGNAIIGKPEEAKYGFTKPQLIEAYRQLKAAGAKRFGLHTMVASNELDPQYIIDTATLLFDLVCEISQTVGITFEFINIGGGIGIPYKPDQQPMDLERVGKGIEQAYREHLLAHGHPALGLYMECGRCITGPYGYLVSRVRHVKDTYRKYVGLDACMANLMRPALYGAYHQVLVPKYGGMQDNWDLGPQRLPLESEVCDVTGSLCENNDKFAIQRNVPKVQPGDLVVICDAGAHGHAMGFQYNGKLRSAELLLRTDGTVKEIRRAETLADYFATLDFDGLDTFK